MNRAIATGLSGIAIAQLLKIPTRYLEEDAEHLTLEQVVSTGGMPSSHSCGVTSLATYLGLKEGWSSSTFALASMLGIIVMYDASTIRRYAGETAIQVNDLDKHMEVLTGHHPGVEHIRREEELKESLGHQPLEVLAGALLGIGIGAVSYALQPKSKRRWFGKK
ncbi:divergent PAP2 family protein [Caldalkalibacillus salinus]|uniref:divergent PAP2 family protein n=1 Tax=Caldalkalibacillus salinus TaxID=2803787 RepID=UPI0019231E17|nr:divergent PAP2 family protein [Caldalkalibacillus salinus]